MIQLQEGYINSTYQVCQINLPPKIQKRLETLGLIKGTAITILNKKSKGAVIIRFRGARFAVGRYIARNILVRK